MMIKSILFILFLTLLPPYLCSSNHRNGIIFYESFENKLTDFEKAQKNQAEQSSLQQVYQSYHSKGIKGKALNLSSDAPMRFPYVMNEDQFISYTQEQSFSLSIWVRTKKGARQGLSIWTNKKNGEKDSIGWCLGTQENGAWFWNMSDGNVSYSYEPTMERQAINDGEWHQLVVSVDRKKEEVWMFKDGKNVAIYQIKQNSLNSMQSLHRTIIGGSDEYYDFGSSGEWTAFNGFIDEATMYDRSLTSAEVKAEYECITGISEETKWIKPDRLKVQVWNIWHGGHRFGYHTGVERVCEVLKDVDADVIGLIEAYGSGAIIADSLGYYFYLISNNLSIMSRYPIEETIAIYKPFYSGGAILDLGENEKLAFFDIWLWYQPGFPPISKWQDEKVIEQFHEQEVRRVTEIQTILESIGVYLENTENIPAIMVGDFNCSSHLDHTKETASLYNGIILERPVSRKIADAGFTDSYRFCNPNPAMKPGFTWSPMYNDKGLIKNENRFSRIDYIYVKGTKILPFRSETIDFHPLFWPSDHSSVVSSFYLK